MDTDCFSRHAGFAQVKSLSSRVPRLVLSDVEASEYRELMAGVPDTGCFKEVLR